MAVSKLDIIEQYFSNDGLLGAGYKIWTYVGGDVTPLATFTDSTGDTEHENPIVLDASGRPPGDGVWLTQGVAYKFILTTDDDDTIETVDNIVLPLTTPAAADSAYTVSFYHKGTMANNNEKVYRFNFERSVDFLGDFLGTYGSVDTNPAATWTGLIKKNGSNVGTIVVTTGGAVSFTTTAGAAQSFAASDILTIVGPASADGSIAGLAVTFAGEVSA
jgi:hypothetical protein